MKHIEIYVKLEMLLGLGMVVGTLLNLLSVVSGLFWLSFVVLVPAFLEVIENRRKDQTLLLLVCILFISFMFVLIDWATSTASISPSNLVYYFVFAALLLYIYIMHAMVMTTALFGWMLKIGISMAVIYPCAYFVLGIQTTSAGYLSMNYSNSNLLGMWLVQPIMFCIIGMVRYAKQSHKCGCALLLVANVYLLWLTGTRNAIVSLILGGVVLLYSIRKRARISPWILRLINLFPSLYLYAYMGVCRLLSDNIYFEYLTLAGKNLSTRYELWDVTMYHMSGNVLLGAYFQLAGNVHNAHLVMVCSYGVIVFICTLMYLFQIMARVNAGCVTPIQKICIIGFFITIFMGANEGSLFSGSLGLYIPACSYLGFAKISIKDS